MADWSNVKRFYEEASVIETGDGFGVALDGKPVKTPGKVDLVVPVQALAQAIAEEWQAQEEQIEVPSMPMLRLAATAIDRVAVKRDEVIALSIKFAETDLLCYRADEPPELVVRQAKEWQPLLDWAATELNAPLVVTEGIVPVVQPHEALNGLGSVLMDLNDLELVAVSGIAAATSSLVIGFAVKRGRLTAEQAAEAGLLEELFQMEQWGEDEIALERQAGIRREINESARLLELLG